jgi:GTP-binding protein
MAVMSQSLPTIAIIGQSNAGKSSLLNRIARSRQAIVAREAGTTRDSVAAKITYQQHDFWLVDTAGLKTPEDDFEAKIQEQITEAVEAADVILVACDSTLYPDHNDRHVAKMAL